MAKESVVYIIEDDPAVLDSLRLLISAAGYTVFCFASAETFLAAEHKEAGCIISDVRLPGISGLDMMRRLQASNSPLPIVFITGHGDIDMAVTAIKNGATDFIEKPFNHERLLSSLADALVKGQRPISRASDVDPELAAKVAELSERQRQVMSLVAVGRSNKEIAAELGISPRTVEVYRAHVMVKLGVKSMAELVKVALRTGVMA